MKAKLGPDLLRESRVSAPGEGNPSVRTLPIRRDRRPILLFKWVPRTCGQLFEGPEKTAPVHAFPVGQGEKVLISPAVIGSVRRLARLCAENRDACLVPPQSDKGWRATVLGCQFGVGGGAQFFAGNVELYVSHSGVVTQTRKRGKSKRYYPYALAYCPGLDRVASGVERCTTSN